MEKTIMSCILIAAILGILIPPLGYLSVLGVLILFIMWDRFHYILKPIALNKPLLFLSSCMFISVLFSNQMAISALFFILFLLQVIHYSIITFYVSKKGVKSLFNKLNYIAIFTSIFGLFQFITGKLEINKHWTGYSESLVSLKRIYSTLYNPNVFAAYLVINICFIISWILYVDGSNSKKISLLLCSLSLILTYSRGSFASLLFSIVIIYIFNRDNRLIVYGAAMIILFFMLNNGANYERVNISQLYSDSSSLYRIEIWRTSFRIFMENPVFGNGVGTLWCSMSHISSKLWGVIYHAHNILLHFGAETGAAGLTAFLWLIGHLVGQGCKAIRKDDSVVKFIALGTLGSCSAIMVHGIIDAAIVVPTLALIIMNFYGMACYILNPLKLNTFRT